MKKNNPSYELYHLVCLSFIRNKTSLKKYCMHHDIIIDDATKALQHEECPQAAALRETLYDASVAEYYSAKIELIDGGYVDLNIILRLLPICKSTWYKGQISGIYPPPAPKRKGQHRTYYRASDIKKLLKKMSLQIVE